MTSLKVPPGEGPVISIDDDADFHTLLGYAYELSGLHNDFVPLNSSRTCLEYMHQVVDGESLLPCLLLIDVNLPGISGHEVVRRIRTIDFFRDMPIISMLSSSNSAEDIEMAKSVGANCYYEKPMAIHKLRFERL